MILVIDNYDSFTYNLVQIVESLYKDILVIANDALTIAEIKALNPEGIIISPGPSRPQNAGICLEIVKKLGPSTPILGVCLGHQTIAEAFGSDVINANQIIHGKTDEIYHDKKGIYQGLPTPFTATRYHSLIVDRNTLSDDLIVTSSTKGKDIIMGIRHKTYPVEGVQFHPESYKTEHGKTLISNFINSFVKKGDSHEHL